MLEARNLCKEYKTKNGPIVKALDNVNIKFEETGMVFILGKSGSGKSTLLNVLGGLDKYDSGEVIVKGKSSSEFKQADFDSYRNTFIGFIFQDYNILEEFTISKNIGLALELQGKKADKKAIEELMEQVDLKGFGKRKPNTLSGGQKQRVAIARALVKNPEIIMADEPTGALDSNTGKQVLDTLKKLSKTKLVLIVSHDREFAEYYGDRIIELADGKIVSDIVKYKSAPKNSNGLDIVDDKILTIKNGTKLDTEKAKTLISFISQNSQKDVIVSVDENANKEFKKIAMIDDEGNKESFKKTENLNIKQYDGKKFKMIRSKLPGKDSFKMGASGLKTKPIRLFFTIILSAIAFAMFGLADTMGSYDKVENTIISIRDSNINYASFSKGIKSDPDDKYPMDAKLSAADFNKLNNDLPDFNFNPVFSISEWNYSVYFDQYIYDSEGIGYDKLYSNSLYGFTELTEENIADFGTLIGNSRLPQNDQEIVLTKYIYDVFDKGEYKNSSNEKEEINSENDLIGKKINFEGREYEVVGIIDTSFDLTRYQVMENEDFGLSANDFMIGREFSELLRYSQHALGYLNKGYFNRNINQNNEFLYLQNGIHGVISESSPDETSYGTYYQYIASYSQSLNDKIIWLNRNKTTLGENEVIVSLNALSSIELDISGKKVTYGSITDSNCKYNSFYSQLESLMQEMNLTEYYVWNIVDYYNAFDTNLYKYDNSKEEWSGYWYYAEFTEEQKSILSSFFRNFTPTHCIDVIEYFESPSVKEILIQQYNLREYNNDYSSYLSNLASCVNTSTSYHSFCDELTSEESQVILGAQQYSLEQVKQYIPNKIWFKYQEGDNDYYRNPREMTIVGIYSGMVNDSNWTVGLISNTLSNEFSHSLGGIYNFAISKLDYTNEEAISKIVEYTYTEGDKVVYKLNNPVMSNMAQINSMIETLSEVFLYVGIGFAVFASLLLLNFITISISYKKREIGVLRAIGARGMDVFKIFFNEAFIIAFINFVLASAGSIVVCTILNNVIRTDYGMLITLLNIGLRQILLMFMVSLGVAFISSFLPVRSIARKKPIDAIRNS